MKKYDGIIFDLDGTLLFTLTDLTNAVNYGLKACGLPALTEEQARPLIGDGYKVLMEKAVGERKDLAAKAFAYFTEYYNAHLEDNTRPYDGVIYVLTALAAKGKKLAIVSNKGNAAVQLLCRKFFAPHIITYFGVTDKLQKKPAPDMLFAAMTELRLSPDSTVMVGDGETDIQMAKSAGIDIISVSWGYRSRDFLEACGASPIIDGIAELPELV